METVAVIFGGQSAEHDVSIVTALANVIKPLELSRKYKIEAVYIAKNGAWYWDDKLKDINLYSSGEIQNYIDKTQPASIELDGGLKLIKASGITSRKHTSKIDIVFPSLHGTNGEDGALMGLLEMSNVPYVGCGLSASVIAMDKVLTKQIAIFNNIPVTKFVHFIKAQLEDDLTFTIGEINSKLNYPLFIKPAHLGSSIGISRVKNQAELINGLEVALHYDDKIIVEEEVLNLIEITLPIIGNEVPKAGLLEKPLTKPEDFFDFETKYMQGGKKGKNGNKGAQGYSQIPADLNQHLYDKTEKLGLKVYKEIGCSGIARVDMLINSKTEEIYFNEINPMPGGLYAHNWNKTGLSNVDLVQKLIDYARERYANRSALETTFTTNYLKQF